MPRTSLISRVRWTIVVPLLALAVLAMAWGRALPGPVVALVTALLAGAVLSAVHHAEVVAHRIGEPYRSLLYGDRKSVV